MASWTADTAREWGATTCEDTTWHLFNKCSIISLPRVFRLEGVKGKAESMFLSFILKEGMEFKLLPKLTNACVKVYEGKKKIRI